MQVWTKLVISIEGGEILEAEGFEYDGEVALCKGDSTAKESEQLSLENQRQEMDIQKQMLGIF